MPLSRAELNRLTPSQATAFELIERAAIAGARAPENKPRGPLNSRDVSGLVRAGMIETEIFAHNWRRITVVAGDRAPIRTAPPPAVDLEPYLTVKAAGRFHANNISNGY